MSCRAATPFAFSKPGEVAAIRVGEADLGKAFAFGIVDRQAWIEPARDGVRDEGKDRAAEYGRGQQRLPVAQPLTEAVGHREAPGMALEPGGVAVQRTVGGRVRYVSCLRFTPRESDGSYREVRERAILYVDGRLDRVAENATEACAGAVYTAFPELEKLTR